MIISISGPTSTGKTTLINRIKQKGTLGKYKNIIVINEVIRDIFKDEFLPEVKSMENMMKNKEMILKWVIRVGVASTNHINNEIKKYSKDDTLIILDRCIVDHFIYTIMHTSKFNISLNELFDIVKSYKLPNEKIDYMFLTSIPENDFYDIDGMRPKDWEESRYLEDNLFQLLFGNTAIKLPYDIDERIKIIEYTINT